MKQAKSTPTPSNNSDDPDELVEEGEVDIVTLLEDSIPAIVEGLVPLLVKRSLKTRCECYIIIEELCDVLPEALTNHIWEIMPPILSALQGRNRNEEYGAFHVTHKLFVSHPPELFQQHIELLILAIMRCIDNSEDNMTMEALILLQEVVPYLEEDYASFDFTCLEQIIHDESRVDETIKALASSILEKLVACREIRLQTYNTEWQFDSPREQQTSEFDVETSQGGEERNIDLYDEPVAGPSGLVPLTRPDANREYDSDDSD